MGEESLLGGRELAIPDGTFPGLPPALLPGTLIPTPRPPPTLPSTTCDSTFPFFTNAASSPPSPCRPSSTYELLVGLHSRSLRLLPSGLGRFDAEPGFPVDSGAGMRAGPSISIGAELSSVIGVVKAVAGAEGGVGRRCESTGTKGTSAEAMGDTVGNGEGTGGSGASVGTVGMTLLIGRFETGNLYSG